MGIIGETIFNVNSISKEFEKFLKYVYFRLVFIIYSLISST